MGRPTQSESLGFFDAANLHDTCGKSQCNSIHNQTYRLYREYYDVAAPSCRQRVSQKQKAERDAKDAREKAEEEEQKKQRDAEDAEQRNQARIQEEYDNRRKSQQEENQRRQNDAIAAQKAKEEADRQKEQERLENNRKIYERTAESIKQSDQSVGDQADRNREQMAQRRYEDRSVVNASAESQRIGLNNNSPPLGTGGYSSPRDATVLDYMRMSEERKQAFENELNSPSKRVGDFVDQQRYRVKRFIESFRSAGVETNEGTSLDLSISSIKGKFKGLFGSRNVEDGYTNSSEPYGDDRFLQDTQNNLNKCIAKYGPSWRTVKCHGNGLIDGFEKFWDTNVRGFKP